MLARASEIELAFPLSFTHAAFLLLLDLDSFRCRSPPPLPPPLKFVGASRLSPDYLTTLKGVTMLAKPALEGMALFRHPKDDALCAVMSHLTGWEPNPLVFLRSRRRGGGACAAKCTLDDPGLGWERLGNPTGEHASFNMQPTFSTVVKDATGERFVVLMSDNWLRAGPRGLADAGYAWLPMEFKKDGGAVLQRITNWSVAAPFDNAPD